MPYHYQPLGAVADEIRLLWIPRRTASLDLDTALDYTLFHTSLRQARSFVALSYCWGDHILNHELTVNGTLMHVTESLKDALQNLQSKDKDVFVWADAICINQKDPIEKTAQVQLMRDIYRTASRVIIWLGPSTTKTFYTMREIRRLGDELIEAGLWDLTSDDILHWNVEDNDDSKAATTKRTILRMKSEHVKKAQEDQYPFWWIMSDLGKRKWFKRIWCIQECTNAKIATFRCGKDDADYTQLWAVALYFRVFNLQALPNIEGDTQAFWKHNWLTNMLSGALPTTVIGIRRKYLVADGHDLRTLLDRVIVKDSGDERIDATDPRDRIYALLGIANDEAANDIVADYTLSCEQAYIITARALLRHGHDDILSLCRTRGTCKNLPSWVPDWSTDLRKPWSTWHVKTRLFNASGEPNDTTRTPIISPSSTALDPHLTLTGSFVDTIKTTGHAFCSTSDSTIPWIELRPFFNDISTFLAQSSIYTPAQKHEAEWRIPVGDTEIADENSQVVRIPGTSLVSAGFAVAKAISEQRASPEQVKENILPFARFQCQFERMYDSRPFLSEEGWVGLCPVEAREGDAIVIFRGARVPYVIRRVGDGGRWRLVGESHVYGIMDGEFLARGPGSEDITLC